MRFGMGEGGVRVALLCGCENRHVLAMTLPSSLANSFLNLEGNNSASHHSMAYGMELIVAATAAQIATSFFSTSTSDSEVIFFFLPATKSSSSNSGASMRAGIRC